MNFCAELVHWLSKIWTGEDELFYCLGSRSIFTGERQILSEFWVFSFVASAEWFQSSLKSFVLDQINNWIHCTMNSCHQNCIMIIAVVRIQIVTSKLWMHGPQWTVWQLCFSWPLQMCFFFIWLVLFSCWELAIPARIFLVDAFFSERRTPKIWRSPQEEWREREHCFTHHMPRPFGHWYITLISLSLNKSKTKHLSSSNIGTNKKMKQMEINSPILSYKTCCNNRGGVHPIACNPTQYHNCVHPSISAMSLMPQRVQ